MEAGFHFFSLNKPMDWNRGKSTNLVRDEKGLSIIQTKKYAVEKIIQGSYINEINIIQKVSISSIGTLYLMDEESNLWMFDYRNQYIEQTAISNADWITTDTLLLPLEDVMVLANRQSDYRLTTISLTNGQVIWSRDEWNGNLLFPLALAGYSKRMSYVLIPVDKKLEDNSQDVDDPEVSANSLLVICVFDWAGRVVEVLEHELLFLRQSRKISRLKDRYKISVSNEGHLYLLDKESQMVIYWDTDRSHTSAWTFLAPFKCSGITAGKGNQLYLSEVQSRKRYEFQEEERFIYKFNKEIGALSPIMASRGRYDDLYIDDKQRIFGWNQETQQITILGLTPRTKQLDSHGELKGIFTFGPFDTHEEKLKWHKVQLFGDIPEETQVRLYYYASDRLEYFHKGNIIHLTSESLHSIKVSEFPWSAPIINPEDGLLYAADGRYLWIRVELIGSENSTPQIKKIRLYYPRTTYLSYLPSIYEEDRESKDFLERFLSLFSTVITSLEEKIEDIPRYFEIDTTSNDFLRWLGQWLGIKNVERWDESSLRLLIKEAPNLYKKRGTKEAIERMLTILLGVKPIIIEQYEVMQYQHDTKLKILLERLYGSNPYCFYVLIPANYLQQENTREFIEMVLESEKPAYTEARIIPLEPWMYLDMHTYVGINTYLSELSVLRLNHRSKIPADTVLIDVDRSNRLSVHTRINIDSSLE